MRRIGYRWQPGELGYAAGFWARALIILAAWLTVAVLVGHRVI